MSMVLGKLFMPEMLEFGLEAWSAFNDAFGQGARSGDACGIARRCLQILYINTELSSFSVAFFMSP